MSEVLNLCSGEGADLNFKIGCHETAPTDDYNPSTNEIWIWPPLSGTYIDMSDYVLQIDEPSSPSNGFIWVKTSSIDGLLFDYSIKPVEELNFISPVHSIKQYQDGTWVTMRNQFWNGTEWIPKNVVYDNGVENRELTIVGSDWEKQSDRLYFKATTGSSTLSQSRIYTADYVNISDYTTLNITYKYSAATASISSIGFYASEPGACTQPDYCVLNMPQNSFLINTVSITIPEDIKDMDLYLGIYVRATGSKPGPLEVYKIWFE